MGDLPRHPLSSSPGRANSPTHDRAREAGQQSCGTDRANRRPARLTGNTHTHHAAGALPAAWTFIFPLTTPLKTLNPKLTIGNGLAFRGLPKRLGHGVTLGRFWRCFDGCGLALNLICERDNARIIDVFSERAGAIALIVCAGLIHLCPQSCSDDPHRHTDSNRSSFIGFVTPPLEQTRSRTNPAAFSQNFSQAAQEKPAPKAERALVRRIAQNLSRRPR